MTAPERSLLTQRVLGYLGACDGRFSDEQVFDVLRQGDEGGQPVADLCAAHGITVPMYCVWRQKYRRLSLDHLRAVRRRAARRARLRLAGVVMAVVGLVIVGPGVLLVSGRDAPSAPVESATAPAVAAPVLVPVPARPESNARPEPQERQEPKRAEAPAPKPAQKPAPVSPPARAASPPAVVSAAADTNKASGVDRTPEPPSSSGRFAVQVAAAQSRAEADTLARRLADAGHEAFVVPVTVGAVEHFRVRVGPFDSQGAAEERARALTRNGFPGAWVTR